MTNILVLFACVAAVACNDIRVGFADHGRKIFDEKIQASPAIWRQVQKITVNASNYEVISAVVVTDERPEKDGDATIVEGGEGQKNVTVELKSPTVFRGFDFHVVVYAVQETADGAHPIIIGKDTEVNKSSKPENEENIDSVVNDDKTVPAAEKAINEELPINEGKPNAPVTTGDQIRQERNTEEGSVVPIHQYVTDKSTEAWNAPETTTLSEQNASVTESQKGSAVPSSPSTPVLSIENAKVMSPQTGDITDSAKSFPKDTLQMNVEDNSQDVSTTEFASTSSDISSSNTENVKGQNSQQNFDSISKELGQKVIYGIKKH